jgi:protein TonB
VSDVNPETIDIEQNFREPLLTRRLLTVAVPGVVITLALCWGMKALIDLPSGNAETQPYGDVLDFVRIKPKEEPVKTKERPAKPETPEAPPPPPAMPQVSTDAPVLEKIATSQPSINPAINMDGLGFNLGNLQEGEYLPIVKVSPIYPERALNRGIEGACTVEYTVTREGTVKDVKILESLCDSWLFQKPSVSAAQRFRYQPKVVNGKAQEVKGVRNRFTYAITGGENG